MYNLPLFPLNVVLFPGSPLHLHIFEPRYKEMIARCQEYNTPFGVVLIRSGAEANQGLAEPYLVGCAVRIIQHEPLSQGRSNITVLGQERFTIMHLDRETRPYLQGFVRFLPLYDQHSPDFAAEIGRLKPWVRAYLALLAKAADLTVNLDELPEDPMMLGYFAANLLQITLEEKQSLLEIGFAGELAERLSGLYRKEYALLRNIVKLDPVLHPSALNN